MYTTPPMDETATDVIETPSDGHRYWAGVLPPDAWGTLTGELAIPTERLNPDHAVVVAVKSPAGVPVARWVALNTVHLEGLLILEAYRKNPAVAGKLFVAMVAALREAGVVEVLTLVQDPAVQALAEQAGFSPVPGRVYKLVL